MNHAITIGGLLLSMGFIAGLLLVGVGVLVGAGLCVGSILGFVL